MKIKNLISILIIALFISVIFVFFGKTVFASTSDGTIDPIDKYAWGENTGWINFGATNGNVHVTDSGLSGSALSENIGWINLANVVNDTEGNLSGYAWGENTGWINFDPTNGGVIINSSGEFTGSALSENIGWIIFGGDYKVKTDWRPHSTRIPPTVSGGGNISATYCTGVVYGDWQPCANGVQYRNVLSQSPNNCVLTAAQEAVRSMVCGAILATPATPVNPNIADEAGIISADNVQNLLLNFGAAADPAKEQASLIKYELILDSDSKISADEKTAINDFIVYGTPSTMILGAGERAGAVNSYFQAFGKLPTTAADWSDVLKIANGRWPAQKSLSAENRAKFNFKVVYLRDPDMNNSHDNAAVTVMAYGLRPAKRNLASEKAAIISFRFVYHRVPATAREWDVVRAIAYSGATR